MVDASNKEKIFAERHNTFIDADAIPAHSTYNRKEHDGQTNWLKQPLYWILGKTTIFDNHYDYNAVDGLEKYKLSVEFFFFYFS